MRVSNRISVVAGLAATVAVVAVALDGGHGTGSTAGTSAQSKAEPAAQSVTDHRFTASAPIGTTAASSPAVVAREWLDQHPEIRGSTPVAALRPVRQEPGAAAGQTIVRFAEVHSGVKVLGGEAVLAVSADRRVVAASAETLTGRVPSTDALIDSRAAAQSALDDAAGTGSRAGISVTKPERAIFDPRILGGPGRPGGRLVWSMIVSRTGNSPLRKQILIDANTGAVALRINMIETALDRRVCDANNSSAQLPCTSPIRTEGGSPTAVADANNAYDYVGHTYAFFKELGRDSIDNKGLRLDSTVRYCKSACPYENAFWDGTQMVFGSGYASSDDVTAHELTHGFTQYTSNLFYYYQSGAISESLSDIFGEFVDQSNSSGNDSAGVKWQMGEDLPGGAIRSMSDPTQFGDPDKMTSSRYTQDSSASDDGGVHTNSGVGNKTAFLIADGGTFNGQTITGIGLVKSKRLWYETALLLRSASDYSDLGVALPQACRALIGTDGISESDCLQVDSAVAATELLTPPPSAPNVKAVRCVSGASTNTWSDGFENPSGSRWATKSLLGSQFWTYSSDPGLDATYATGGTTNLWIDDQVTRSDNVISMPTDVTVPANGYFHFRHAYGFEQQSPGTAGVGDSGTYDGGVIEYSTNAGSTWSDASPLIEAGGYGGSLSTLSDSPLSGRSAFVGQSYGYVATRINLSSLAGRSIRFRFRMATDTANENWSWGDNQSPKGWFIDDVSIYSCSAGPGPDTTPPQTTITAGPSGLIATASATFRFASSEDGSRFTCAIDGGTAHSCTSPKTYSSLGQGTHSVSIRAIDAANNVDPTPAIRSFTVDTIPPDTRILTGPTVTTSRRPAYTFTSANSDRYYYSCTFDLAAFARCSSPWSPVAALTKGYHTFRVRTVDRAGNVDPTPATRIVLIR